MLNVPIVDIRDIFYNCKSCGWFVTVVLNWSWSCPLGYIWVYLDACLVVTIAVYSCNLAGRGHGSCQTPYNAQDRSVHNGLDQSVNCTSAGEPWVKAYLYFEWLEMSSYFPLKYCHFCQKSQRALLCYYSKVLCSSFSQDDGM